MPQADGHVDSVRHPGDHDRRRDGRRRLRPVSELTVVVRTPARDRAAREERAAPAARGEAHDALEAGDDLRGRGSVDLPPAAHLPVGEQGAGVPRARRDAHHAAQPRDRGGQQCRDADFKGRSPARDRAVRPERARVHCARGQGDVARRGRRRTSRVAGRVARRSAAGPRRERHIEPRTGAAPDRERDQQRGRRGHASKVESGGRVAHWPSVTRKPPCLAPTSRRRQAADPPVGWAPR
jgi:hypothetical protein